MKRFLVGLVVLAACVAGPVPPSDGLPRVHVDGAWLIPGHKHGDPVLHLDACQGCATEFARAVDQRLVEIQQAAQKARAERASSVAPPSTQEAPK